MTKVTDTTTKPTAKVTPITKAVKASTKPADPEPDEVDEDLPGRPYLLTRPKMGGAVVLMGFLLYLVYDNIGALHVAGSGFLALVLGFLVVAAIVYVVALVVIHVLHLHHRSIGGWLFRSAGRVLGWAGRGVADVLNSTYVWLGALAVPLIAWARDRWDRRKEGGQEELASPDDEDDEGWIFTPEQISAAIRAAWCRQTTSVRTVGVQAPACFESTLPPGAINPEVMAENPSFAAEVLGKVLGAPVRLWHVFRVEDGSAIVRLIAPADAGPEPAPKDPAGAPAEPAEATAAADPARNGDSVTTNTTDAPARRAGSRFGGRRTFPEAKALVNLVDDANPTDGDEIDHHDLMLGLAATLYDLAQAWQGYCERCEARTVRLGKGSMEAANALAETLTDAAEGSASASKGFEDYYEGVNEEVSSGKELPKDGDFLTGQGAGG